MAAVPQKAVATAGRGREIWELSMRAMIHSTWKWLTVIACWYFQDRPRTWAIAYLGAIPAFGLYYLFYTCVVPYSFYAPYAQYDPDLASDRVALTATLQGAILRAYETAIEHSYPDGIPLGGPSKENLVLEVSKDGPPLAFTMNWLGPSPYLRGRVQRLWPLVTLTIKKLQRTPRDQVQITVDQAPFLAARSDVRAIGTSFFETMFEGKGDYFLIVQPDEASKIERYWLGAQGRTDSFSNNIVRMMYLSAVVQTTLGLGDLLPMTTCARIAVAVQAIFGIIFAGFFLNATAARAAKGR